MAALLLLFFAVAAVSSFSSFDDNSYKKLYRERITGFLHADNALISTIKTQDPNTAEGRMAISNKIAEARLQLKGIDIWLRYLEPIAYRKINGPLPVEWETEVFEKFEPPYRREGYGLSLAEIYLDEKKISKDSLLSLVDHAVKATEVFLSDSITVNLNKHDHFFLANRLYLLNLAAIYTTGFECPDSNLIITELVSMLRSVSDIYKSYNESFPGFRIKSGYTSLYDNMIAFVGSQPGSFRNFDHYHFIRDYVNPLFAMNQQMIREYQVISNNYNDFSLQDSCPSIFNKSLYKGQNEKGIYIAVDNEATLAEIRQVGKLLFYDPIISGNNKRSCASCHKPTEYFTDTSVTTAMQFDESDRLPRNTPSLINVVYNHLLMLDGKHISLMAQAKDVTSNPIEMGGNPKDILNKVMNCPDYAKAFRHFVKLTPNSKKLNIDHIVSAIILYYSSFSNYYSAFDRSMNAGTSVSPDIVHGFNIFMSKARCGTCHFVPQFNGVKPPYIGTEFEVIGVPADTTFKKISPDSGRAFINPAEQTIHAFRTGSIRNTPFTKPYMHNGIFHTLEEVIDFYDAGGGAGKGLKINNQTLARDSLKLSATEKKQLLEFIRSLNEDIQFEAAPASLPVSKDKNLNNRKPGGEY